MERQLGQGQCRRSRFQKKVFNSTPFVPLAISCTLSFRLICLQEAINGTLGDYLVNPHYVDPKRKLFLQGSDGFQI
jgi:hypothetical protein